MIAKELARVLAGLVVAGGLVGWTSGPGRADEKEPPAKKSGTVVGTLTAKGPSWVEVKADGEERARRYVAHWRGGAPKDGGGPDKKTVAVIRELKVGSRVRLEWSFHERARIDKIEVLKRPGEKDKEKK